MSDADDDGYYNMADPLYVAALANNANTLADCDDQNPNIHPGLQEIAGNHVDEDCDGYVVDSDNDAYISPAQSSVSVANVYGLAPLADPTVRYSDCDDWDPTINPTASNLNRESVFAAFFDPVTHARSAAMCNFIGSDGGLNAHGRGQLVDVNCDGLYSDLDGDGYTIAGDESLGVGLDIDCDDLDPRLTTQIPCVLPASAAALDGGNCTPVLEGSRPCNSGYVWSPPVNNCIDINECALGTATCDANQICVNTPGSFVCPPLVSPLVAGPMTLSSTVAYTIHVSFQPATGVAGTMTYTVYTVPGTFSAPTIEAVQSEGTLFTTVNDSNDLDIPGLVGNANYQVSIVVQDANYDVALYPPQSILVYAPPQKSIFVISTTNGNLGGISGADALCNASNPNTIATSKAFLVDGTTRVACTSPDCQTGGQSENVDWAMQPNTVYTRMDGTVISITDGSGIPTYNLTNGFAVSGEWYTGVSPDWVRNYSNCNNWTDGTSANQANVGSFSDLTQQGLAETYITCDQTGVSLVCVEQ